MIKKLEAELIENPHKDYELTWNSALKRAIEIVKQSIREDMEKCEVEIKSYEYLGYSAPKCKTVPFKDKCPACQRDNERLAERRPNPGSGKPDTLTGAGMDGTPRGLPANKKMLEARK